MIISEVLLLYITTSVICWWFGSYIPHPSSFFVYILFLYINQKRLKKKLFLKMEREEYARMRRKIESDSMKRKTINKTRLNEIAEKDRDIEDIKRMLETAQKNTSNALKGHNEVLSVKENVSEKTPKDEDTASTTVSNRKQSEDVDINKHITENIMSECVIKKDEHHSTGGATQYMQDDGETEDVTKRMEMEEELAFLKKIGDENTYKLFFANDKVKEKEEEKENNEVEECKENKDIKEKEEMKDKKEN